MRRADHRGWTTKAACLTAEGSRLNWFPEEISTTREARTAERDALAICAECPVIEVCLEWALKRELFGVWGGTTAAGRRSLRKEVGVRLSQIKVGHTTPRKRPADQAVEELSLLASVVAEPVYVSQAGRWENGWEHDED